MILKVNGCSIDTDAYELRRNEELIPVEPQVFDCWFIWSRIGTG